MFWGYLFPKINIPNIENYILAICEHGGLFIPLIIEFFVNT